MQFLRRIVRHLGRLQAGSHTGHNAGEDLLESATASCRALQVGKFQHRAGITDPRTVGGHMELVTRLQDSVELYLDTARRRLSL